MVFTIQNLFRIFVYLRDKATDGDMSSGSLTAFDFEPVPWYSAELGGRFTAIRLNIMQFSMGYTYITDHLTINEAELRKDNPWIVLCQNAGTGFKISAVPKPCLHV